jgi:hypothetical protein
MEKEAVSQGSLDSHTKAYLNQKEVVHSDSVDSLEEGSDTPHFDASRTKQLLRKLDWHLVPFLSLLYLYVLPDFDLESPLSLLLTCQPVLLRSHQHRQCQTFQSPA